MDVTAPNMQHIPYSQMSQSYSDIFSGRTEIWFTTAGGSLPHVKSGKVRSSRREWTDAIEVVARTAHHDRARHQREGRVELVRLLRAKGTPKAIIDKVNRELQTVIGTLPGHAREGMSSATLPSAVPPDKLVII
jgi:hypothetical protein